VSDSSPPGSDPIAGFDLEPGLFEYYSSQAELMLAQYDNINRLLGPTTHGTPSGDLCENLLREVLRKFLPPALSVDKGYFYGRSQISGKDTHCPEIDILVHDAHSYAPLGRMGGFVIVQPQAVRAMIQVKRRLTAGELNDGFRNIVEAKQQLIDVLWQAQNRETPGWTGSLNPPRVFTGIFGFDAQSKNSTSLLRKRLLKWAVKHRAYNRPRMVETEMYVLPAFVGALSKWFLCVLGSGNYRNPQYLAFDSMFTVTGTLGNTHHPRRDVCIQALLATMRNVIGPDFLGIPPLALPRLRTLDCFHILQFDAELSADFSMVKLRRTDGWTGEYYRKEGSVPTNAKVHLICDNAGRPKPTTVMVEDLVPVELFVQRKESLERYVRNQSVALESNHE
jgi:hypothetical protein